MAKPMIPDDEEFEEFEEDDEDLGDEKDDEDEDDLAPLPIMPARLPEPRKVSMPLPQVKRVEPTKSRQPERLTRQPERQPERQPYERKYAQEVEEPEPVQAQPQYVAVPRAVPVETMLNELYDGQQEIRQILLAIVEKLK